MTPPAIKHHLQAAKAKIHVPFAHSRLEPLQSIAKAKPGSTLVAQGILQVGGDTTLFARHKTHGLLSGQPLVKPLRHLWCIQLLLVRESLAELLRRSRKEIESRHEVSLEVIAKQAYGSATYRASRSANARNNAAKSCARCSTAQTRCKCSSTSSAPIGRIQAGCLLPLERTLHRIECLPHIR